MLSNTTGLLVFLHHCNAFNDDLAGRGERLLDLALLALIFAGDDDYGVTGFHIQLSQCHFVHLQLEYFGSERNDLHIILFAKLSSYRPKDTGALGLLLFVDDDGGIVVEADIGAVRTTILLARADDNGLHDLALLHGAAGIGGLHGSDNHIAHAAGAAERAAQHA